MCVLHLSHPLSPAPELHIFNLKVSPMWMPGQPLKCSLSKRHCSSLSSLSPNCETRAARLTLYPKASFLPHYFCPLCFLQDQLRSELLQEALCSPALLRETLPPPHPCTTSSTSPGSSSSPFRLGSAQHLRLQATSAPGKGSLPLGLVTPHLNPPAACTPHNTRTACLIHPSVPSP